MMNYEVNPFQDYESITIDELKDQANCSLPELSRWLRMVLRQGWWHLRYEAVFLRIRQA